MKTAMVMIGIFGAAAVWMIASSISATSAQTALADACKAKGGIPIVSRYTGVTCFKREAVIE